MTPEEREALLAGYALGTLSAPDAVDAERLVRSDPDAAAEFESYRELTDLIALSVPMRRADPSLRDRVISAARRERSRWRRPSISRRHLPVASLAAALLIVVVWALSLQDSLNDLKQQTSRLTAVVEAEVRRDSSDLANAAVEETRSLGIQLENAIRDQQAILTVQADPDALRFELEQTSSSFGARGYYLWSEDAMTGIVVVHDMPALPLTSNYKVFLRDTLGRETLAGTFSPDQLGSAAVVLHVENGLESERIFIVAGSASSTSSEGPLVLHGNIDREALAAAAEDDPDDEPPEDHEGSDDEDADEAADEDTESEAESGAESDE